MLSIYHFLGLSKVLGGTQFNYACLMPGYLTWVLKTAEIWRMQYILRDGTLTE